MIWHPDTRRLVEQADNRIEAAERRVALAAEARNKRIERSRQRLSDLLSHTEIQIEQAQRRLAEHRRVIDDLGVRNVPLTQLSMELDVNLQEGLRLLIARRQLLAGELAFLPP